MMDLLVGEPLVNICEFIFGYCKFECFVFFVNVCVEFADCSIVCASEDAG